jgi:hypothetical protein
VQLPLQSCRVHRKWRLFRSGNLNAAKVAPATWSLSLELLSSCRRGCRAGRISSSIGQPHSSSRRCEVSPAPSCATHSVTWVPKPAETQHSICSDVSDTNVDRHLLSNNHILMHTMCYHPITCHIFRLLVPNQLSWNLVWEHYWKLFIKY